MFKGWKHRCAVFVRTHKTFSCFLPHQSNVLKYFVCPELGIEYFKAEKKSQTVVRFIGRTGRVISITEMCFLSVTEN